MVAGLATTSLPIIASGGTEYPASAGHVDGNETMQNLGRSVALVDLNDDGISDLVVGAPYTTAGGLKNSGSVRVYLSEAGVPMAKTIVINGSGMTDLFGWSVAGVGDVNGDGVDDLGVGVPLADPGGNVDAGQVLLYLGWPGFDGTANLTIEGASAGEEFGFSLAAAGDANRDGFADIAVGAPFYSSGTTSEAGRVYLYHGGSPMNALPDKTFTGSASMAHLGWSVAGGVSVDGDTDMDLVAGAPGQGTAGAAYIVRDLSKANPGVTIVNGKKANENFSLAVALVPDMNGDTIGDIAIGAPTNSDNGSSAGAVYVLYGGSKFNTAVDLTIRGAAGEWFGWSLAAGDIHQDGHSDLLVGAPNSHLNATTVGRAYVFFGGTTPSASANITLVPDAGSSFFGGSVAVGPNMTGDIAPDYVVGDPMFNIPGFPNAGRAYIYAGLHIVIPKNPVVMGYVRVPGTSLGLADFTVTLESSTFSKSTTTDSSGYYEIVAVPGTYWLNVSRTGYVNNSTAVTLAMDDVLNFDFYPLTVPRISGTVRDAVTSSLIQGATVALYSGSELKASMTTPANGSYWFYLPADVVPPEGSTAVVTIAAWNPTHYTSSGNVTIARNESKTLALVLDRFPVISGMVRDAVFLSAVRSAMVVANQGAEVVGNAVTNIRGEYVLSAVNATAGPLHVNVTASGYFRQMGTVTVDRNGTYVLDFMLVIDSTPPTSQLSALTTYTTTENVSLSATADDANGIKEVQLWYRLGGSGPYALYGSDQTEPYSFSLDTATTGGDGLYEFYSIAVDLADNAESAPAANDSWTFVDSHMPGLSVSEPSADEVVPSSTVTVAWSGSDAASGLAAYEVQLDSDGWLDKGLMTSHTFESVPDGPHTVHVRATDNASLVTVVSVPFTVDTHSPTSSVSALPPYTSAHQFVISASAADPYGVSEVQFWYRFNGSGDFVYLGSDTEGPYEMAFDADEHEGDGLYEFYSLALDTVGNNETPPTGSDTRTVVDRGEPEITITAPGMGGTVGNSSVSVSWTASDAASGIWKYSLRLDNGTWTDIVSSSDSMTVQVTAAHGNHTVYVDATDWAGWTASASVSFMVDLLEPTVTIMSPADGDCLASNAIVLRWLASDQGSGLMSVEVSKDGIIWTSVDTASAEHVFSAPAGLPENEYIVQVRVTDRGGLTATDSVTVILDITPPTVGITNPLDGDRIGTSDVTLRWEMADDGSGIATVYVSVDGGLLQNIGNVNSYELSGLADGPHNVTLRALDRAGNQVDVSVGFTVEAAGGISALLVAGIALVAVVAIAAAALMVMRRKGGAAGKPPDRKK